MLLLHVVFDGFAIHVAFVTQVTPERLVVVVFGEVPLDVVFSGEALGAQRALIGFVPSVQPHVPLHVISTRKRIIAHQARVNIMLIQIVILE